ncbi:hypothetical protein GQ54DRAFT_296756 [Martensiomyces pterosporus]|nr:hypothetical protein GQ54DRAFT_296756 [Martensiomyces pterosporus]
MSPTMPKLAVAAAISTISGSHVHSHYAGHTAGTRCPFCGSFFDRGTDFDHHFVDCVH